MNKYAITLCYVLICVSAIAGNSTIDSLQHALKNSANDTSKVKILLSLSEATINSQPDKSVYYAYEAKLLSSRLMFFKGMGEAYYRLGAIHQNHSNFLQALENYTKAADILEKLDVAIILAHTYNAIGNIHYLQAGYELSLNNYLKSMEVYEKLEYEPGIAHIYNNIGTIYHAQHNLEKASEYNHKSLEIYEKLNNQSGIATSYNSIGEIYMEQEQFDIALNWFLRSNAIKEKTGAPINELAASYSNIGQAYLCLNRNMQALDYLEKALILKTKLGDKFGIAKAYNNLGSYYLVVSDSEKSSRYFNDALIISKEINAPQLKKDAYYGLSQVSKNQNKITDAYDYFVLYKSLNDSLLKNESLKKITQIEMQSKFDKIQKVQEFQQKEKEIEHQSKLQRQKTITYSLLIVVALLVLLAVLIYRNYRINKKFSRILSAQKEEILMKNSELVKKNDKIQIQSEALERVNTDLEKQRDEVTQKNNSITDSIQYAWRIQTALLQETSEINSLFKDSFILFKPRDIVSGDFYWAKEIETESPDKNSIIFSVADCTGHGVPGAFMSMLGIAFLNEIVNNGTITPNLILTKLRSNVIKSLHQTGESENLLSNDFSINDGMDIALCLLDQENNRLQYAGAYNPVYIVSSHENEKEQPDEGWLSETKGNKMPIAIFGTMEEFTNHEISLNTGDAIYLFTDGYTDQFGGPSGKKFLYRQFKDLLISIRELDMSEQLTKLENELINWCEYNKSFTGEIYDQVDDVCVVGVRV